jgi:hypothetical protein
VIQIDGDDRARLPQRPQLAGTAVVNLTNQATSLPFVKSRNSHPSFP